jgi:hypothetical protein
MKKLICIITGPERNGTTFVEKILFSHPDIFSGFETGLLLDENFNTCEPFCKWIYNRSWQWGLSREIDLTGKSFKEKYDLLFKHKGSYHDSDPIQKLIYESKYLVDKTPAYIRNLEFVHKNIPKDIPIIIVIKKLEDDYISKIIKRNHIISRWEVETKLTIKSLKYIETIGKTHKNIFIFRYDEAVKYTDNFIEKIKNILQHKINTNTEMSVARYLKKIGGSGGPYGDWKSNESKSDEKFQKYKNLQTEYDKLINNLKEPLYGE